MHLDKIEIPCTFWYEDEDGNKVPFDFTEGFPHKNTRWKSQHLKNASVQHSVCLGSRSGGDNFIVRALKWLLHRAPDSWKKPQISFGMESTINCCYPIVKHLVEQRNFTFNDACVTAADLCERCMNICLWELNHEPCDVAYLKTSNTSCESCQCIDEPYIRMKRIKAAYKTMERGGSIAKAFKEGYSNDSEV